MVLRDAAGLVVDSLNYGLLVDPWAAEGYQGASGSGQSGCRTTSPASVGPGGRGGPTADHNRSAGRFPDGADTDSNCADFLVQAATTLPNGSSVGATSIKVASVADFSPGQTIVIDTGAIMEMATIATVGTAGATVVGASTSAGTTVIPIANPAGFGAGQTITIDSGSNAETAIVADTGRGGRGAGALTIALTSPLRLAHAAGVQVSGTGITLAAALTKPHASGAQVTDNLPTPGAPNKYSMRSR
jgi:hypothetical protein